MVVIALAIAGYQVFDLGSGESADRPAGASTADTRHPRVDQRIAVNEEHVFEGEINRRGKPVGFHARPGGRDPAHARVERVRTGPNRLGVYVATVAIRDHDSNRWLEKRSSFFPDDMSRGDVLSVIRHAYANREPGQTDRWRGPSGLGFTVEGWVNRGRINTAYPIFR